MLKILKLLTFDGKKSSAEDKSRKIKAQGAMLKSFKEKLIADFRHKSENVQVRDKTLSCSQRISLSIWDFDRVKLHQKLTSIISGALNKGA